VGRDQAPIGDGNPGGASTFYPRLGAEPRRGFGTMDLISLGVLGGLGGSVLIVP
jgi:hypothetical protein